MTVLAAAEQAPWITPTISAITGAVIAAGTQWLSNRYAIKRDSATAERQARIQMERDALAALDDVGEAIHALATASAPIQALAVMSGDVLEGESYESEGTAHFIDALNAAHTSFIQAVGAGTNSYRRAAGPLSRDPNVNGAVTAALAAAHAVSAAVDGVLEDVAVGASYEQLIGRCTALENAYVRLEAAAAARRMEGQPRLYGLSSEDTPSS